MTDSGKPKIDLEEADGITVDEDGNARAEMETLQKGGGGEIEDLGKSADSE